MCKLHLKAAVLANWPVLLLTGIIADCTWNAVECSCYQVFYEKVEKYKECFRECTKFEN